MSVEPLPHAWIKVPKDDRRAIREALGATAVLVWEAYLDACTAKNHPRNWTDKTMAGLAGISIRTLRRQRLRLEAAGYLEVDRRAGQRLSFRWATPAIMTGVSDGTPAIVAGVAAIVTGVRGHGDRGTPYSEEPLKEPFGEEPRSLQMGFVEVGGDREASRFLVMPLDDIYTELGPAEATG